jgi:hypothetical protein
MALELNSDSPVLDLFGETTGCLLVEVSPAFKDAFEEAFEELPLHLLGRTVPGERLTIHLKSGSGIDAPVSVLVSAWNTQP